MTYHYRHGTIRWRRLTSGDPRGYRPNKGWEAEAGLMDFHPITGRPFKESQWWIREQYTGGCQ